MGQAIDWLIGGFAFTERHVSRSSLSTRELDVLPHLMKGSSNKDVWRALDISEDTV